MGINPLHPCGAIPSTEDLPQPSKSNSFAGYSESMIHRAYRCVFPLSAPRLPAPPSLFQATRLLEQGRGSGLRLRHLGFTGPLAMSSAQGNSGCCRLVVETVQVGRRWYPRRDSNPRSWLRRPVLYPLSYGGTETKLYQVRNPDDKALAAPELRRPIRHCETTLAALCYGGSSNGCPAGSERLAGGKGQLTCRHVGETLDIQGRC